MSWEVRGKKRFLYRSIKTAGKTKKRYLGGGQIANLADLLDKVTAGTKQRRVATLRAEAERIAAAQAALAKLEAEVELLAAASKIAARRGRFRASNPSV